MQYILLNAAPILLATAVGFVVSLAYAAVSGRRAAARRGDVGLAAAAFVSEGWLACILAGALILAPPQASPWVMALGSAVVIWIGFVLPALLVSLPFRGVRLPTALADGVAWLAVMLAQASVLHLAGLHRPA